MKKGARKTIKKFFIPHTDNDFKPGFFGNKASFVLSISIVSAFFFTLNIPDILTSVASNSQLSSILPSILIELTNEERNQISIDKLNSNEQLNKAAQMKAEDMASKDYFSHTNPEGKRSWHWLQDVGYKYQYAGENLAVNFYESEAVTVAWMNSPTHKANIVKSAYTEIGTGVATGTFNGVNSIYVAQVYADPFIEATVNNQASVIGSFNPDSLKNFFSYLLYDNHDLTNRIFIGLLIFVFIALTLTIFVKFKIQHRHLIRNALIICTLIIILLLINQFMERNELRVEIPQITEMQNLEFTSIEYYINQNGETVTR